jgi:hypothetical protein
MKIRGVIYRIGALVLISCMVTFSCKKDEPVQPKDANGTVNFGINIPSLKSALKLKAAKLYSLNDVKKIVLTIQNSDGSATAYASSEINILQMNGIFYSQKITLKVGSYKLTEFELLDASDNTIFAAPLAGSLQAQNVANPLPVAFDVLKDEVTPVYVEVLSTENHTPEDFGLARFVFNEVKTFSFLIVVADSKKDEILSAKLTVSSGSYNYMQDLENIANNLVTVKDSLNEYKLTVTKPNYTTYIHTFTYNELKAYEVKEGNLPLVIELDELSIPGDGLVAYYPFNGNANDESGNGNNGIVNGATLITDRFGNANSAYSFNGFSGYLVLPNTFDFLPRTIDLWFNTVNANYSYSYGAIYQSDNPFLSYGAIGVAIKDIDGKKRLLLTIAAVTDSFDLVTNSWYNIAMTADLDNNINYYVNGGLIGSKKIVGYLTSYEGLSKTIIGSSRFADGQFFNGKIDDIRIYNRVLNDSEINLLYQSK